MASKSSESVSFERRDEENQHLREENARLRLVLAAHGISVPQFTPDDARPVQTITPAGVENKEERARKRIALFRSLFRGREDVYAWRWENSEGRSGYSPAALKDWKAINSSRPEDRKKVDRNTRQFLPLSNVVIENHLLGKETIGIYPLLPDETCWFLAVDFDKKTWTDDSRAFLDTCRELTATPTRKDGRHPIIYMQCGPVRFSMSAKAMAEMNPFEHRVVPRHTDFRMPLISPK